MSFDTLTLVSYYKDTEQFNPCHQIKWFDIYTCTGNNVLVYHYSKSFNYKFVTVIHIQWKIDFSKIKWTRKITKTWQRSSTNREKKKLLSSMINRKIMISCVYDMWTNSFKFTLNVICLIVRVSMCVWKQGNQLTI